MRRPRGAAVLLVAATALAGCPGPAVEPASTVQPAPTLVPLTDDLDAAYTRFWAAWLAASDTSDPAHRELAEHAADPLLDTLRTNLAAARDRDHVTRGTVRHQVRGMEIDGEGRRIVDCVGIGDWRLFRASSGELVPEQLTGARSQLTTLVFRRHDGKWKATNMYAYDQC